MTREKAMESLIDKLADLRGQGKAITLWPGKDEEALAFAITDMKICAMQNMGGTNRKEKKEG